MSRLLKSKEKEMKKSGQLHKLYLQWWQCFNFTPIKIKTHTFQKLKIKYGFRNEDFITPNRSFTLRVWHLFNYAPSVLFIDWIRCYWIHFVLSFLFFCLSYLFVHTLNEARQTLFEEFWSSPENETFILTSVK